MREKEVMEVVSWPGFEVLVEGPLTVVMVGERRGQTHLVGLERRKWTRRRHRGLCGLHLIVGELS